VADGSLPVGPVDDLGEEEESCYSVVGIQLVPLVEDCLGEPTEGM
jgi:hypothetical protein